MQLTSYYADLDTSPTDRGANAGPVVSCVETVIDGVGRHDHGGKGKSALPGRIAGANGDLRREIQRWLRGALNEVLFDLDDALHDAIAKNRNGERADTLRTARTAAGQAARHCLEKIDMACDIAFGTAPGGTPNERAGGSSERALSRHSLCDIDASVRAMRDRASASVAVMLRRIGGVAAQANGEDLPMAPGRLIEAFLDPSLWPALPVAILGQVRQSFERRVLYSLYGLCDRLCHLLPIGATDGGPDASALLYDPFERPGVEWRHADDASVVMPSVVKSCTVEPSTVEPSTVEPDAAGAHEEAAGEPGLDRLVPDLLLLSGTVITVGAGRDARHPENDDVPRDEWQQRDPSSAILCLSPGGDGLQECPAQEHLAQAQAHDAPTLERRQQVVDSEVVICKGMRVVFSDDSGRVTCGKAICQSSFTKRWLFVSGTGDRVCEIDAAGLTDLLAQGRASITADDRAHDAMRRFVDDLRRGGSRIHARELDTLGTESVHAAAIGMAA